jgi:bacillithiol system protein YtxJ
MMNKNKLIIHHSSFIIFYMAFKEITSINELENSFTESSEKPVLLFKHSLTCPISRAAYEEMSQLAKTEEIALVIIQDSRPISDEIAARTSVKHESPQAIILQSGKPMWNAAHYDITKAAVVRELENLKQ